MAGPPPAVRVRQGREQDRTGSVSVSQTRDEFGAAVAVPSARDAQRDGQQQKQYRPTKLYEHTHATSHWQPHPAEHCTAPHCTTLHHTAQHCTARTYRGGARRPCRSELRGASGLRLVARGLLGGFVLVGKRHGRGGGGGAPRGGQRSMETVVGGQAGSWVRKEKRKGRASERAPYKTHERQQEGGSEGNLHSANVSVDMPTCFGNPQPRQDATAGAVAQLQLVARQRGQWWRWLRLLLMQARRHGHGRDDVGCVGQVGDSRPRSGHRRGLREDGCKRGTQARGERGKREETGGNRDKTRKRGMG